MSRIDKDYFTLAEVVERWDMPRDDLLYLVENELLRLSIRLLGKRLERGTRRKVQLASVPGEERKATSGVCNSSSGPSLQVLDP